ncbi:maleylpyruvate isomerase family mycothiol-dependent enzyme [Rhodococcus jostii]|uniref:TIGR03083 family protein n=1 Tax=Rhodococcus jostii TaxID=132919 RepID=A0A1H4VAE9_RHOJO|nr:maleylpyruvate isomerase family mycothiol-dependent enzyme [Rhodococcus jostii]SEC77957.1 TIGR03083 family protein [Rhodococcus jostii]
MTLAREEREEFAELLAGLSAQQWESPSLCERWRVRDVAAHVISYDELDLRDLLLRFGKGGFLQVRVNELGVADLADRTTEELVDLMRIHAEPSGLPAGFGGMIGLVDGMIHQQDIRRPLAIPRTIPPQRLRAALDFARFAPLIRGAWRARGVTLVAADLDWSYGRGPQVRGSGEALLMAMAGRRDALGDLTGPGRSTLAAHIGA